MGLCPLDIRVREQGACYWAQKGREDKVAEILGEPANSKSEIKRRGMLLWQQTWDEDEPSRRTHALLPDITERQEMKHFKPFYSRITT